jgi:hypothetical protein
MSSDMAKENEFAFNPIYLMPELNGNCSITIGKFNIVVMKTDEGVVADIYDASDDGLRHIAGCYAFENELRCSDDGI